MEETNTQRVAKNTVFLFIRMLLVLIVGLYTSRLILRTLGFVDFGIYNVVGSIVVFLSFLGSALTKATYRYLSYELGTGNFEKLRQIYSMAINCHVLFAVVFWILIEIGGVWFINQKLNIEPSRLSAANWAFQFSLLIFCIGIIKTPFNSNIIAHEKMRFYAMLSIIEVTLRLIIVFLLIYSPIDKLITYAFLSFFVTILIFVVYVIYCHRQFKECRYIYYWNRGIVKQFTIYSGWSLLVDTADVTVSQCVNIFFNIFLGLVVNAALGIANQVIGHLNAFLNTFTQAFNPQIIKSYAAKDYEYFMKMIYSTSKISYFLLLFISMPVVINIDFILKIWLGDYPLITSTFVRTIIFYSLIDALQCPLWQAVYATGYLKIHQILMGGIKIMAIPLTYFSLKWGYSAIWALGIWAGLNLVCAIVRTIYMKYLINLSLKNYVKEVIISAFFITLISVPLPWYIAHEITVPWFAFLVSSSLFVLLICCSVYYLGLNKREREIILSFPFIVKIKKYIDNFTGIT